MAILNTNDYSSIEDALNVSKITGDSIYIPSGVHEITATLNITGKTRIIFGDGQNNTIIRMTDSTQDIIAVEEGLDYLKFSLFTLTRDITSTTNDGLVLTGQNHNALIDQVQVQKCKIGFNSKFTSWMQQYNQCRADGCTELGFYANGVNENLGGAGTTIIYNQCYANDCRSGFKMDTINETTMTSCAIDHFVHRGVSAKNSAVLCIQTLHTEANDALEDDAALIELSGTPSKQLILDGLSMTNSVAPNQAFAVRVTNTNSTVYLKGITGHGNSNIKLFDIREFSGSGENGEYHIYRSDGFDTGISNLVNGIVIDESAVSRVKYGRDIVSAGGTFNTGLGRKPDSVVISINDEAGADPIKVVAQVVDYYTNGDVKVRYAKISDGNQDFGTYNISWTAW